MAEQDTADHFYAVLTAHADCDFAASEGATIRLSCGIVVDRPEPDSTRGWVEIHREHVAKALAASSGTSGNLEGIRPARPPFLDWEIEASAWAADGPTSREDPATADLHRRILSLIEEVRRGRAARAHAVAAVTQLTEDLATEEQRRGAGLPPIGVVVPLLTWLERARSRAREADDIAKQIMSHGVFGTADGLTSEECSQYAHDLLNTLTHIHGAALSASRAAKVMRDLRESPPDAPQRGSDD